MVRVIPGSEWTAKRHFPGGVFTRRDLAEAWIDKNRLTGALTLYPVDTGAYEWAIQRGLFQPSMPHQTEPEFIAVLPGVRVSAGRRTCGAIRGWSLRWG